jgi:hypothetical protein
VVTAEAQEEDINMSYQKRVLGQQLGAYVFKDPPLVIANHSLSAVSTLAGSMQNNFTRGEITENTNTHMSGNYMRGSSRLFDKLI